MKRIIKRNIYGNWVGYVGRSREVEFGENERGAKYCLKLAIPIGLITHTFNTRTRSRLDRRNGRMCKFICKYCGGDGDARSGLATLRAENERLRECLHVTDYFLHAMTGADDEIANAIFKANKEALK